MNTTPNDIEAVVEHCLIVIAESLLGQEMAGQPSDRSDVMSIRENIEFAIELARDHGEYSESYYLIVSLLEIHPEFSLSAANAINLLKTGLLFRHKSDHPSDAMFDYRNQS